MEQPDCSTEQFEIYILRTKLNFTGRQFCYVIKIVWWFPWNSTHEIMALSSSSHQFTPQSADVILVRTYKSIKCNYEIVYNLRHISTAWKYLPLYQGFAVAYTQINTAFSQWRGMTNFIEILPRFAAAHNTAVTVKRGRVEWANITFVLIH